MDRSEEDLILQKIIKLNENEVRILVMNVFGRNGNIADLTHGSDENGADVILELSTVTDALGRNQYYLFQIKVGDIGMADWRNTIYGQLTQLYCRPYRQTSSNESAPRRIVLITTGRFKERVKNAINDWNTRLPVPIEAFSGRQFAKLLSERYGIRESEIDELIIRKDVLYT